MLHPVLVSSLFLIASLVGAVFTKNAQRPITLRGRIGISPFFAGWLTSELPLFHVTWQVLAAAAFVAAGALRAWPGWIAAAICIFSWATLVELYVRASQSRQIVEGALAESLGPDYRDRIAEDRLPDIDRAPRRSELMLPFVAASAGIERIKNLSYGPYGRRNLLDIDRPVVVREPGRDSPNPSDRPRGFPVLVNVHGGAWILGDKSQQARPLLHHMASLGWVCVAINYRLSPRSTFPDHVVDVKRAIAWVKEHIAEYGGDPDFVAITGGSAGGHLSSLAALTANDPAFQPGFEDADTTVQACVPFYGVYDFTNRQGKGRALLRLLERVVMKRRLADARDAFERASPMSRVHAGAPPFLVIHGTNDTLVPVAQARLFVELLRATSKAPVAYIELPLAQHAFEVFSSARTAHVIRGVGRFLSVVHAEYLAKRDRVKARRAMDIAAAG